MQKKKRWYFFALYAAIVGAFCGLEIDTFVEDLPFFEISTFVLLLNVLSVLLIPPLVYALFNSIRPLRNHRAATIGMLLVNSVYIHFVVLLLLYKAARDIDFDFYFFWYNTSDALPVLWKIYAPWLIGILLTVAAFAYFQAPAFSPLKSVFINAPRKAGIALAALVGCSILSQFATIDAIRGSTAGFVYANFLSDRQLRTDYRELYRNHIADLRKSAPTVKTTPALIDGSVFFVKLESLNGLLAGPRVTPHLMRASGDGVLFNKSYANSIQSIRGYECILCGVPPNLAGALVDEYSARELKELCCLPKLFRQRGYRTLYFFGGSRNPRIKRFAESIGFERVVADEIAKPGDIKFDWGYREDIFYTRVHEYIQANCANEKLFVFIDTGATNHTPFEVLDDSLRDRVPFPRPDKFEQRISNTTFVQDAYFGRFYDIFKKYYAEQSTLVAASDHSWPIPIHKNNIYNERGAFEENFLISMLFVPPGSKKHLFAAGRVVEQRFSQMDIFPTFLELIGMQQERLRGESFAPWLLRTGVAQRKGPKRSKISIQPYGGGYISAVRYPEKYLFDTLGKDVKVFNLEKDPLERFPSVRDAGKYTFLIRDFFLKPEGTAGNNAGLRLE